MKQKTIIGQAMKNSLADGKSSVLGIIPEISSNAPIEDIPKQAFDVNWRRILVDGIELLGHDRMIAMSADQAVKDFRANHPSKDIIRLVEIRPGD